jgi:sulfatase maturation enzyme AslB (radical SAM superfamily)
MLETYVIHITKRCNMACVYCYEQDKTSEYSIEELKKNSDDIFKDIKNNKVNIEFLGGEPLLRFDLLKDIYNYLEEKYKDNIDSYAITTNGTIINDEIIKFLKEDKNIYISISMDGTRYSNQLRVFKNFTNSHDVVIQNIRILQNNRIQPYVHIVTHPYNIAFMFENIKYLYNEVNIQNIGIGTIESTMTIDETYCEEFKKQIKQVANFVIKSKNLYIDLFNYIKPFEDVRTYVKDKKTGKTLFESYGRIKNSIFENDKFNIIKCTEKDEVAKSIYELRKFAYDFYRSLVEGEKNMSILSNSPIEDIDGEEVNDCVGLIGNCSYVTNPIDGKLHKNILIKDKSDYEKLLVGKNQITEYKIEPVSKTVSVRATVDNIENKSISKSLELIAELISKSLIEIENIKKHIE